MIPEKRSNFGCTQSLVSHHSSLLTFGPRRSVKPGQRVDQGIVECYSILEMLLMSAVILQPAVPLHTAGAADYRHKRGCLAARSGLRQAAQCSWFVAKRVPDPPAR